MDGKASKRPRGIWLWRVDTCRSLFASHYPARIDTGNARHRKITRVFIIISVIAGIAIAVILAIISQTTKVFTKEVSRELCATQVQRKEWRTLTDSEKLAYISGELCLMNSPSQLQVPGLQSRWDDLQWVHLTQSSYIHDVGQFLPWHRYYVYLHEYLLRTECNYNGTQPYWEQLLDTGSGGLAASPIWDPVTGVGGNGTGPDSCIADGPFANLTLHMDNDGTVLNYCVSRSWNETVFQYANQTYVDRCFATQEYATAWECFHDAPGPHTAGHSATGGLMALAKASPGDPVFFFHHANLDRLWWEWQKLDLPARLSDMTGRNTPTIEFLTNPTRGWDPPGPSLTEYSGDPGDTTTLKHVLWMGGVIANATVADVMDIQGKLLCFDYV